MTSSSTDLWKGDFGDRYRERNPLSTEEVFRRANMWRKVLAHMSIEDAPKSFLDIGAGMGANICAIDTIYKYNKITPEFYALEPNDNTRGQLSAAYPFLAGHLVGGTASAIELPDGVADMTYTYGVLIHVPDSELLSSMNEIYRCSKRWILCAEYFNPDPVTIPYRGQRDALFKRDYGSIWLDKFGLQVVAYCFEWKRMTELDNVTWFLLRKTS